MSYFNRVVDRMLGSGVRNMALAITADQIPAIVEIKKNARARQQEKHLNPDVATIINTTTTAKVITSKAEEIEEQQSSRKSGPENEKTKKTTPSTRTTIESHDVSKIEEDTQKKENLSIKEHSRIEESGSPSAEAPVAVKSSEPVRKNIQPKDKESEEKEPVAGRAAIDNDKVQDMQESLSPSRGEPMTGARKKEIISKQSPDKTHSENLIVAFPTTATTAAAIIPSQPEKVPEHQLLQRQSNALHDTIVTINIGRIEVRASTTHNDAVPKQPQRFTPPLTLTEYLKQRRERGQ